VGLVPAKDGEILFYDRKITHVKPYERAKAGIGYVPQGREIFPPHGGGESAAGPGDAAAQHACRAAFSRCSQC
jgi:ABC-type branched-subunit amino acid transport system ATPase component